MMVARVLSLVTACFPGHRARSQRSPSTASIADEEFSILDVDGLSCQRRRILGTKHDLDPADPVDDIGRQLGSGIGTKHPARPLLDPRRIARALRSLISDPADRSNLIVARRHALSLPHEQL